jgi:UDP-N-acetyl-D-mannosaminuronic acid transferase (WecB/TagA/CpsF family)
VSEEIADVVARIKQDGHDIVVVLNATIAVKAEQRAELLSLLNRT